MKATAKFIASITAVALLLLFFRPSIGQPTLQLDGKIGETRTLDLVVGKEHWGGNSSGQHDFAYEPPPGWIILSYAIHENSRYGDSFYAPTLTSRGSNYTTSTHFNEALDDLESDAGQYGNTKAKADIHNLRTNSSNYDTAFSSTNNLLRIVWGGHSHEVKHLGVVIDTKTASLDLSVTVTIARSLTDSELSALIGLLKSKIERNEDISDFFSR